ncbi:MAG: hypothetical protein Q8P67_08280 [archaeon]|nr:hypothetical protein [archaeon]
MRNPLRVSDGSGGDSTTTASGGRSCSQREKRVFVKREVGSSLSTTTTANSLPGTAIDNIGNTAVHNSIKSH